MRKKIPLYNIELNAQEGIFCVSLVNEPAIEVDFVALKSAEKIQFNKDQKKKIVTGPLLIPNQYIFRRDNVRGEYYIKWSEDTIRQVHERMMKTGSALTSTSFNHEQELKGNYLIEAWVVDDPVHDKAYALGFKVPTGTLMQSYKIADDNWYLIDQQLAKGFSIDAYVDVVRTEEEINLKNNKKNEMSQLEILNKIKIALGLDEYVEPQATGVEYTLDDGTTKIVVSAEGTAIYPQDNTVVQDGDYTVSTGEILTVAGGKMVGVQQGKSAEAEPEPTAGIESLKSMVNQLDPSTQDELIKAIEAVIQAVDAPVVVEPALPAGAVEEPAEEQLQEPEPETEPVAKTVIQIDGVDYEVDEAVADYIKKLEETPSQPPVNQKREIIGKKSERFAPFIELITKK